MNETLISSNSTGKATRQGRRYPFLSIVAGVVALIALTVGVTSALAQPGATHTPGHPSSSPAGPAAPMGGSTQREAAMAYNSTSGEYLVVWNDFRNGERDIYGQRMSSSGALLGSEIPISTAPSYQSVPKVAYNSASGEYLVVWSGSRPASGHDDIYGQRVSGSGALVGSEIPISTKSKDQWDPAVAYNSASGEYLVVWSDDPNGEWVFDIYGQRVSGSGALLGSEIPISTASEDEVDPAVAYNSASGEYLVVWSDDRTGDDSYDIYGQRVSGSGALVGSDFPISTISYQHHSAVVYNSTSGEYLVVWQDWRPASKDIYGQRVSSSGALVGSEIPISTASGDQSDPAVAYNSANGEYLIAWSDDRTGAESYDIYGQRVSGGGALMGSEIPISTASGDQSDPAVAYNSASGEYLVVWSDDRTGPTHIYGQRVSGGGALVGSNFPITGGTPGATPTTAATATLGPPTATPTPCTAGVFSDVPNGSTYYPYVTCLANQGIVGGYSDCTFRPGNPVTRGQLSKIVSLAANFTEPHSEQTFEDVAVGSTFHLFVERLASRSIISGYACGGTGEPCVAPGNRPYFRTGNNVTRGQTSKIVAIAKGLPAPTPGQQTFQDVPTSSTFWMWIEELSTADAVSGYACGGTGEPCVAPGNRPYFRPANSVTRGQASKIVANTFFPTCQSSK